MNVKTRAAIFPVGAVLLLSTMVILYFPNEFYISTPQLFNRYFEFTNFGDSLSKRNQEFWSSLQPQFQCPEHKLIRVGKPGDGGKWTCGLSHLGFLSRKIHNFSCLVYSFGVRDDSTFEAGVLRKSRCILYAYDPTADKIAAPITPSNPRVHFFRVGMTGENSESMKTLKTLMKENGGHKWIDILKMDIEGFEYATLSKVFEDFELLPFGQLLVEIHFFNYPFDIISEKVVNFIKELEERGLRMFSIEGNIGNPNCCAELAFINLLALDRFLEAEEIKKLIRNDSEIPLHLNYKPHPWCFDKRNNMQAGYSTVYNHLCSPDNVKQANKYLLYI